MATIDYKQKIKDYMNSSDVDTLYKSMLGNLFPELAAESEDERIRKDLLDWLKSKDGQTLPIDRYNAAIAWLKKGAKGNEREIPSSEQKPADKVEPKFKAGDWVVYKGDICQIVKREEGCNKLVTVFGIEKEPVNERNLSTARLWTIQDAKDGDVLADNVGVILFRKIGNEKVANVVDYHCAVFKSGSFLIQKGVSYWGYSKDEQLRPATKEQRERFFGVMRVAGYEWNADKKELKKIEQKPQSAWKPSNEQMKALEFYIKTYVDTEGCYGSEVLELYEQLKKLREE